jgi:MYXO-CTERM domain-containing protein
MEVETQPGSGFSTNFIVANATPYSVTPEPGAMCLLGIGLLGLLRRSRRKSVRD